MPGPGGGPSHGASSGAGHPLPVTGGPSGAPFLTAIAGTGTGQYPVDQYGQPWMFRGDFCWALITNAGQDGGSTTWESDLTDYLSTRSSQGFNFTYCAALGCTVNGAPNNNGETWDGVLPFTGGVVGTMNAAYWARASYLVSTAESYGMTVIMNFAPTETFPAGCVMNGATTGQCTAYGTALAGLFASSPNVAWACGDDYFDTYDTQYDAILAALRAGGDSHLVSIENYEEADSRYYAFSGASCAWGLANAQFNWIYTYNASYVQTEYAYTEPGAGGNGPPVVMDGYWDDGPYGGADFMRIFAWWTLSSGARGQNYGSQYVAYTPSGFIGYLTSGIDSSALQATYWDTFAGFGKWHELVPDTGSALVTAGRGTHLGYISYTGTEYGGTANTYVTASKTPDGSLAVIYNPAANTQTITVNGAVMRGGAIGAATWVDPANGATASAGISSTYTRSAANSVGEHDWLLVLQA